MSHNKKRARGRAFELIIFVKKDRSELLKAALENIKK